MELGGGTPGAMGLARAVQGASGGGPQKVWPGESIMRVKRAPLALFLLAVLSGCGTALTCGNEFGAPPERALWCSSPGDFARFFMTAPPPVEVPAETVQCVETLGEPDCFSVVANGG